MEKTQTRHPGQVGQDVFYISVSDYLFFSFGFTLPFSFVLALLSNPIFLDQVNWKELIQTFKYKLVSFSAYMLSLWIPILNSQSTGLQVIPTLSSTRGHYTINKPFTVILTTKPISDDAMKSNFVPK